MTAHIGNGWDDIIEKMNARLASIGTRCLEHLGRGLELKIPPETFVVELGRLLAFSSRIWLNRPVDRGARQDRLAAAERLLKELDRAAAAGLDDPTLERLRWHTQQTIVGCKAALRQTGYSDFILACARVYVAAFDKRPGRSQTRGKGGKARECGPFVDFAFFVLSDDGAPLIEKSTLARYVTDDAKKLDQIWKRHERLKASAV